MSEMEKQVYLNGIVLAQGWLTEAELKGNPAAIASFRRILEYAIQNYSQLVRQENQRKAA